MRRVPRTLIVPSLKLYVLGSVSFYRANRMSCWMGANKGLPPTSKVLQSPQNTAYPEIRSAILSCLSDTCLTSLAGTAGWFHLLLLSSTSMYDVCDSCKSNYSDYGQRKSFRHIHFQLHTPSFRCFCFVRALPCMCRCLCLDVRCVRVRACVRAFPCMFVRMCVRVRCVYAVCMCMLAVYVRVCSCCVCVCAAGCLAHAHMINLSNLSKIRRFFPIV